MATAKRTGSMLGNREICSVCLEPFRGRDPKLMPCFHTFCLPCLTRMAEKAKTELAEQRKVSGSIDDPDTEVGAEDVFIICPSCRTDIQVPPEGAHKFQGNFYLPIQEQEGPVQPILCDQCDQGQVASHCCTQCYLKLCFHCHRTHRHGPQAAASAPATVRPSSATANSGDEMTKLVTKGKGQLDVISKVISQTADEEKELHKQKKIMEDNLHDLYTVGLARFVDARDELLRKIRSHTESSEEKLKTELADLQRKYNSLAHVTSQSDASSITVADLTTALMPDAELNQLKTRAQQTPGQFFRLVGGDRSAVALVNGLRGLIFGMLEVSPVAHKDETLPPTDNGDFGPNRLFGPGRPHSPSQVPVTQQGHAENPALLSRVGDLTQKVESTLKRVKESESREKRLQVEMRNLMDEVKAVRDKNSFLIQDIATVQGENSKLREDVSQLQRFQQSHALGSAVSQQTEGSSNTGGIPQNASSQGLVSPTGGFASAEASADATVQGTASETRHQIQQLQQKVCSVQDAVKKANGRISSMQQNTQDELDMQSLNDRMDSLQESLDEAFKPIYFKAELGYKVTTKYVRPLICKEVECNEGDGYNQHNGKFCAPVFI
ncbi:hypothetical protein ACOMHN_004483 [Nucella lapillus]